jgi:hypothetical protein
MPSIWYLSCLWNRNPAAWSLERRWRGVLMAFMEMMTDDTLPRLLSLWIFRIWINFVIVMECEHRLWVSHLVKQIIHIWDKSVVSISWIKDGHMFFDYEYVILIASPQWLFNVYKYLLLNIIWLDDDAISKCLIFVESCAWSKSFIWMKFVFARYLIFKHLSIAPWWSLQNNVYDTMRFWRFMLVDFQYIWMCCKFINIKQTSSHVFNWYEWFHNWSMNLNLKLILIKCV